MSFECEAMGERITTRICEGEETQREDFGVKESRSAEEGNNYLGMR